MRDTHILLTIEVRGGIGQDIRESKRAESTYILLTIKGQVKEPRENERARGTYILLTKEKGAS
jgi:hypothetical protein